MKKRISRLHGIGDVLYFIIKPNCEMNSLITIISENNYLCNIQCGTHHYFAHEHQTMTVTAYKIKSQLPPLTISAVLKINKREN